MAAKHEQRTEEQKVTSKLIKQVGYPQLGGLAKFWKSKVSFEKSNASNFGNQKCHLKNQTRQILETKSVI